MFYYIFKEKLLIFRDFSKNFWHVYVVLPIMIVLVYNTNYSYSSIIMQIKNNIPPIYLSIFISIIVSLICIIKLTRVLPPIQIDEPVLFALFNTPRLQSKLVVEYTKVIIRNIAIASLFVAMKYIILSQFSIVTLIAYSLLLTISSFAKWIEYNKRISFSRSLLIIIILSVFLIVTPIIFIPFAVLIIIIELVVIRKMDILWNDYFYDMKIKYSAVHSSANNDMARMAILRVLIENRNTPQHFVNLNDFKVAGYFTIIVKSIINIIRTEKLQITISLILFAGGIVTFIIAHNNVIFCVIMAMSICALEDIFELPFEQIMKKIEVGFIFPYSYMDIFKGHTLLLLTFLSLFVIPISIINGSCLLGVFILILILMIVALGLYFSMLVKKAPHLVFKMLGFIIIILSLNFIPTIIHI